MPAGLFLPAPSSRPGGTLSTWSLELFSSQTPLEEAVEALHHSPHCIDEEWSTGRKGLTQGHMVPSDASLNCDHSDAASQVTGPLQRPPREALLCLGVCRLADPGWAWLGSGADLSLVWLMDLLHMSPVSPRDPVVTQVCAHVFGRGRRRTSPAE